MKIDYTKEAFIKRIRNEIYNRIKGLSASIGVSCVDRKVGCDELIADYICHRAMEIENLIDLLDEIRIYERGYIDKDEEDEYED